MTEFVPVEAFVGDHSSQVIEISREDLPRDLYVVWEVHRAVNVRDSPRRAIHEKRRFHRLERTLDTFCVIVAGRAMSEAGGVDSLNLSVSDRFIDSHNSTR